MWSVPQFEAAMAAALGGHVAERLVFGRVTTGASNDLRKAASIARAMVADYGMSAELGALALGGDDEGRFYRPYGEKMAERVDSEVHRLVAEARTLAEALLAPRSPLVRDAAIRLMDVETLDGAEIASLFGPRLPATPALPGIGLPPSLAETAVEQRVEVTRPARRSYRPSFALPFSLALRWRPRRKKPSRAALAQA